MQAQPIWDIPLRLFHWLLVIAIIGAIITGQNGIWFWHEKFGLAVLGLLVFRLIWGVIGGHHARFANFRLAPASVLTYLHQRRQTLFRHTPAHEAGHSPFGAWATLLILAVLFALALSGNMANNGILYEGPMARVLGIATISDLATEVHESLEGVLFFVIALHLIAILAYRLVWGIRLLPAMTRGRPDTTRPAISTPRYWLQQISGIVLLIACVGLAQSFGFATEASYL